jgi:hypothetical protein
MVRIDEEAIDGTRHAPKRELNHEGATKEDGRQRKQSHPRDTQPQRTMNNTTGDRMATNKPNEDNPKKRPKEPNDNNGNTQRIEAV